MVLEYGPYKFILITIIYKGIDSSKKIRETLLIAMWTDNLGLFRMRSKLIMYKAPLLENMIKCLWYYYNMRYQIIII